MQGKVNNSILSLPSIHETDIPNIFADHKARSYELFNRLNRNGYVSGI
ncbi:hypothetical protein EZS27_005356 [termite gut metagenome]|uniref:Uncharacterized protein n=1 Tax=termite gut metagenome TaxID=433724 RepID=A0A5J4SMI6_9ZZZZ